jgi:hypothetical protein
MDIVEDFQFIEPLKCPVLNGYRLQYFVEFLRPNGLAEQ